MSTLRNIDSQSPHNALWIGLNDINSTSHWQWTDATSFNYGNTTNGYPWSSDSPSNHHCISISQTWTDIDCTTLLPFACNTCTKPNYFLSTNTLSLNAASYYCIEHCGSTLASIHSAPDQAFMRNIISNGFHVNSNSTIWIGLYYSVPNDEWKWIDGTVFDYQYFAPDINLSTWDNYACVVIHALDYTWRLLKGSECAQSLRFLCNSCNSKLNKYLLLNRQVNYTQNKDICDRQMDTNMISIHNDDDMLHAQLLCEHGGDNDDCWIGLQQEGTDGVFTWNDDTRWDYGTAFGVSPWVQSNEPNKTHEQCVGLSRNRRYLWQDVMCSDTKNVLCYAQSELCFVDNWESLDGDALWEFDSCNVIQDAQYIDKVVMNTKKKWMNDNGVLVLEYVYRMKQIDIGVGMGGVLIYNRFAVNSTYCDYYYIGIADEWYKRTLFLIKYYKNVEYKLQSVEINTNETIEQENMFDILHVQVSNGTQFDITLNNKLYISFNDAINDSFTERNVAYVGLKIYNVNIHSRSLYISGTAVATNDNDRHTRCRTTTKSPSNDSLLKTTYETHIPDHDNTYGMTIKITFEYEAMHLTNASIKDLRHAISGIIDDVIQDITNCMEPLHHAIDSIDLTDDNTITIMDSIMVCNYDTQKLLIGYVQNKVGWMTEQIINISAINIIPNTVHIEVIPFLIHETTVSPRIPSSSVLFYIVLSIAGSLLCVLIICGLLIWKWKKLESENKPRRRTFSRHNNIHYDTAWGQALAHINEQKSIFTAGYQYALRIEPNEESISDATHASVIQRNRQGTNIEDEGIFPGYSNERFVNDDDVMLNDITIGLGDEDVVRLRRSTFVIEGDDDAASNASEHRLLRDDTVTAGAPETPEDESDNDTDYTETYTSDMNEDDDASSLAVEQSTVHSATDEDITNNPNIHQDEFVVNDDDDDPLSLLQ
eukprot:147940_1